jgi:hypothetical protein
MAERDLERQLRMAAGALDAKAPPFDLALLRGSPRRFRRRVVLLGCVIALVGVAAAAAAVPALRDLFDVDEVSEIGGLAPGVAPPYAGVPVPVDAAQEAVPFTVRRVASLGAPDEARVRYDITGGMVTFVYDEGRVLFTQWRTSDVQSRIAVVPGRGRTEEVTVDGNPGLWIEGTARGTFTLTGADGGIHHESFEVSGGVLMWRDAGMTFLLQGAGDMASAVRLSSGVGGAAGAPLSVTAISKHKLFSALVTHPSPLPVETMHTWKVRLFDRKHRPVARAHIAVSGDMPAHGHGLPTTPIAVNRGHGLYELQGMMFQMPGRWYVQLQIRAAGRSDRIRVAFTIAE